MVICHECRFIFLKTSKTAGTSVEIGLSKFCGPDDVLTPLVPVDEQLRMDVAGRGAQNHFAPWWDYRPRDVARLLAGRGRTQRFHSHIQAADVRQVIGDSIWKSYFTFCFVRNPWDRVMSHYYWRTSEPRPPLGEFIESKAWILTSQGWDVYTIEDEVVVDRVCRYESIGDELRTARKLIGLSADIEIPSAKSGFRPKGTSYRVVMTDQDRDLVASFFHKEIEMFEYVF